MSNKVVDINSDWWNQNVKNFDPSDAAPKPTRRRWDPEPDNLIVLRHSLIAAGLPPAAAEVAAGGGLAGLHSLMITGNVINQRTFIRVIDILHNKGEIDAEGQVEDSRRQL